LTPARYQTNFIGLVILRNSMQFDPRRRIAWLENEEAAN
jgi:hypothetical protein